MWLVQEIRVRREQIAHIRYLFVWCLEVSLRMPKMQRVRMRCRVFVLVVESGPSMLSGLPFSIHIESVLGWSCSRDGTIGV